jgi:hypothetical protein
LKTLFSAQLCTEICTIGNGAATGSILALETQWAPAAGDDAQGNRGSTPLPTMMLAGAPPSSRLNQPSPAPRIIEPPQSTASTWSV